MARIWTPEQRETFMRLAYVERMDRRKIAEVMGVSDVAVRQARLRYPDTHPLGGVPLRVYRPPQTRKQITLAFEADVEPYEERLVQFIHAVFRRAGDEDGFWRRVQKEGR